MAGMVRLPKSRRDQVDELADNLGLSYNSAVNMLVAIGLDQLRGRGRRPAGDAATPRGWEDVPLPLGDAA